MTDNKAKAWCYAGIPILFLVGAALHFTYQWLGRNVIVAVIAPINESVWEHTKMVLVPIIVYWWLYYFVVRKSNPVNINRWATGAMTSLMVSIIAIPFMYYFYTSAFGVHLLAVDISLLFIALAFGQTLGWHVYVHGRGVNHVLVCVIITAIIFCYGVFTFFPPHIPLFIDYSVANVAK
ncbi:MAG: DUF6512 family protein [Thermoguttaceae bacterium]